jgi:hypothetical protein
MSTSTAVEACSGLMFMQSFMKISYMVQCNWTGTLTWLNYKEITVHCREAVHGGSCLLWIHTVIVGKSAKVRLLLKCVRVLSFDSEIRNCMT